MRPIHHNVNTLVDGGESPKKVRLPVPTIAASDGVTCRNFDTLQNIVARVSYLNPHHDIFLRGQTADHRNARGSSSLLATLFRVQDVDSFRQGRTELEAADQQLLERCQDDSEGTKGLKRLEWARWCLIQHYGIAPTPMLDLTRSPRIAASFATQEGAEDCFVYVIGLPYPDGNLTFDLKTETVIANLRNLMPPRARRPHWQQGYLTGSYPDPLGTEMLERSKDGAPLDLGHYDLAQRLLCKVKIPAGAVDDFWPEDNRALTDGKLRPPDDPVLGWLAGEKMGVER